MTYSRTQIGLFVSLAAVAAVVAVVGFGVPLGTLLIIGLVLCCPLMMLGMHGGGHDHETQVPAPRLPDREHAEGHVHGR